MRSRPGNGPIILAAGGTGGHMFPAEALARALLARGRAVALVTDARGQAFGDALSDVPVHRIRAATLGAGLLGKVRTVAELGLCTFLARRLLGGLDPAVVVGFGGYPSVPTMLAAQRMGVATLIHEQNAVLGRANRLLAKGARVVATSFPSVAGLAAERQVRTGNPVRPAIAALRDLAYAAPHGDTPIELLITGGSQGAQILGEIIPAAAALLAPSLKQRLRIFQQARAEQVDAVRAAYELAGIQAEVAPFFKDMPARLAACQLAVTRAGASTVAELAACGRPALLVPYPHATDDHQTANAKALAASGGAWVVPQPEFTPPSLAARLALLLESPATLAMAADASRGWGIPDAAEKLADAVLDLAPGNGAHRLTERHQGVAA
jgi:UDP-N-acetylglucosamine--N-acetylmuramyl-(pentapeptide) pyrophosphoryl-undecaprenol N-acetylglucosamine transferase